MSSSAAATVVALMRDLPKSMKLADLGEALLDNGSVEQLWDAHVDAALLPASGTEPDRDTAARDIEQWYAPGSYRRGRAAGAVRHRDRS